MQLGSLLVRFFTRNFSLFTFRGPQKMIPSVFQVAELLGEARILHPLSSPHEQGCYGALALTQGCGHIADGPLGATGFIGAVQSHCFVLRRGQHLTCTSESVLSILRRKAARPIKVEVVGVNDSGPRHPLGCLLLLRPLRLAHADHPRGDVYTGAHVTSPVSLIVTLGAADPATTRAAVW